MFALPSSIPPPSLSPIFVCSGGYLFPMDGGRQTDDYLDGIPSWFDYLTSPQAFLSQYGHFPYLQGTDIPVWNDYFHRPPSDDSDAIRTRMYTAVDLVPRNKRARFSDDEDTLRRQLPEVAPRSGKDDECAICLQHLSSPEEEQGTTRAMPCSHVFHERCIFQWVRRERACPLCRRKLPTPQQQEYDYHDDDYLQLTMPVPREMLQIEVL